MAKTYDPYFLAEIGARGMSGDTSVCLVWYRRALALGMQEARERLLLHGGSVND